MIFGTLVFIPTVLGKDVVDDMAKTCDKIFVRPYFTRNPRMPRPVVGVIHSALHKPHTNFHPLFLSSRDWGCPQPPPSPKGRRLG